jgi:hypothetical protein
MSAPRRASAVICAVALTVSASTLPSRALDRGALQRIATQYTSGLYTLMVGLHEPDMRAESMQTPTLELAGWHHHNPAGVTVLAPGSRVEVTGVFNYGERGLFLELSKDLADAASDTGADRPRIRIRLMVAADAADPAGQQAQALALIQRVLAVAP